MNHLKQTKSFYIPKSVVYEAYKRVQANDGSAGVDKQSLRDFEQDLSGNLYKLWNRMSAGSYFPPPVMRTDIPKDDKGGIRPLGIPTVSDRVAQMVVKILIEPELERVFHPDSYGYRPGKSAHDAIEVTRKRCWKRAWVLDMDIKGFFDNIDHGLMMKAVRKHVHERWMLIYIERWLKAPVLMPSRKLVHPEMGTPQGGVISPLLANLFLHYVFDVWVPKNFSGIQFARYADDIVCHCMSEREAKALKIVLDERFKQCGLTLHPEKTKIVYCKSSNNKADYPVVSFDFLGFTFKPRLTKSRYGKFFVTYTPAISGKAAKKIHNVWRSWKIRSMTHLKINELSRLSKPAFIGWINYYGRYGKAELARILFRFDRLIWKWAHNKYKKLRGQRKSLKWLKKLQKRQPGLFVHWEFCKVIGW